MPRQQLPQLFDENAVDRLDAHFFEGISYTIIPSETIDAKIEDKIKLILHKGNADFIPLLVDGRVDEVRAHTHIIAETVDFPDYYSALDHCVHVVRPSWLFSSVMKGRQSQTRQHSPDPAMFFGQVIVSCADLPEGDKDAIISGVLAMGGLYSSPLTKLVTHVVTLSTDNDKCRLARERMPDCMIVLPHWFDDCFKLGKLISETPYAFPSPEILRLGHDGPVRPSQSPDIQGATSAVAGKPPTYHPPVSPSQSRKELVVFKDKKILFSGDLNVNSHLTKTLQTLVEQAGGEMVTSVDECNTYIGHYRDGMDYRSASQAGKEVANLSWFYNVINRNRWTNPLSKLLHYPVPKGGIPGFKGLRISLSNYSGEARLYLENLVKEAGGDFTKTMKQDNTHLITAHKRSEKCDAAEEWNINIINHLWLEESYAKCAIQSLTHPRYTHFPERTNLGEIVGQTPIDLEKVKQHYFNGNEQTIKDVEATRVPLAKTSGTTPHPYRGAVDPPQRGPRKTVPASSAVPAETVAVVEITHDATADAMETVHERDEETLAPQTARKPRSRKPSDMATPSSRRTSDQENETPPTTGRASKNRALDAIHKQKEDIALYQREMKRKGGVIQGGRRVSEPGSPDHVTEKAIKKKRASGEVVDEDGDSEMGNAAEEEVASKPVGRQSKKAKKSDRDTTVDLPLVKYRMLVTGDERWKDNPKKEDKDARKLRALGVELVQEPSECNLLCAPSMKRTKKFVCALAMAPEVVSSEYLDYLLNATHNMRDPIENPLIDREFEERFGLRLRDSIERARVNKQRLLKGWTIFLTPILRGGLDTWKDIITINSGTPTIYRGRTGLHFPKPRTPPSQDPEAFNQGPDADDEVDIVYLVSGTEDDEVKLWKTFRSQAKKQGLRTRIVSTEWLLHLAMCQQIEWDDNWEHHEDRVPGYKAMYGR